MTLAELKTLSTEDLRNAVKATSKQLRRTKDWGSVRRDALVELVWAGRDELWLRG